MRVIYNTHEAFPPSSEVLAAAAASGACEVVHRPDLVEGVHEIQENDIERICAQVDQIREQRLEDGFTFNGVAFQSRQADRESIAGAATAATVAMLQGHGPGDLRWANPDADFVWISTDNSLIPMDAPTVLAFFSTGVQFKSALIFHARALKDALRQGDEVDINDGWP